MQRYPLVRQQETLEPCLTTPCQFAMSHHVANISKSAWFHHKQITQISHLLEKDSLATLMPVFVSSRLGTFKSLLYGIPQDLNT